MAGTDRKTSVRAPFGQLAVDHRLVGGRLRRTRGHPRPDDRSNDLVRRERSGRRGRRRRLGRDPATFGVGVRPPGARRVGRRTGPGPGRPLRRVGADRGRCRVRRSGEPRTPRLTPGRWSSGATEPGKRRDSPGRGDNRQRSADGARPPSHARRRARTGHARPALHRRPDLRQRGRDPRDDDGRVPSTFSPTGLLELTLARPTQLSTVRVDRSSEPSFNVDVDACRGFVTGDRVEVFGSDT